MVLLQCFWRSPWWRCFFVCRNYRDDVATDKVGNETKTGESLTSETKLLAGIDDVFGSQFSPPVRWVGVIMYYYIEPEVAGGFGKGTKIDDAVHPPVVSVLDYQLDDWQGDDILETFPCFVITRSLAVALVEQALSGVRLDDVIITLSDEFSELYPSVVLPEFVWLKVEGVAGHSDFGLAADGRLVISIAAKKVLSAFNVENAEFQEFVSQ